MSKLSPVSTQKLLEFLATTSPQDWKPVYADDAVQDDDEDDKDDEESVDE